MNEIYISKTVKMNKQNNNTGVDSDHKVEKLIKGQLLRYARRRRLLCKNGKLQKNIFFLTLFVWNYKTN